MSDVKLKGLLIRTASPGGGALALGAADGVAEAVRSAGFATPAELFDGASAAPGGLGAAGAGPVRWQRAAAEGARDDESPWDVAHAAANDARRRSGGDVFVEPDLEQRYIAQTPGGDGLAVVGHGVPGRVDPPIPGLPNEDRFAWFLEDGFSQLRAARERVARAGVGGRVRIAHVDTGFDPDHITRPDGIAFALQRNFVEGEPAMDARDPNRNIPQPADSPGHGTGTLGILAGRRVRVEQPGGAFDDFLGGAPEAEIIPIRCSNTVALFTTGGLVAALKYLVAGGLVGPPPDVVSLSMGGVASAALAEVVNRAYERGVCIVAAAGNNFASIVGPVPTRFIVYPARFRRVIAACGVMADRRPYFGLPLDMMQGNWGPDSKMASALAAYTPNIPWAELGSQNIIDRDGAGTSSATPQVAAAAALWIALHRDTLDQRFGRESWKRVEAVRNALFRGADHSADGGRSDKLGNGILRAAAALDVAPLANPVQTPPDTAFGWLLRLTTGIGLAPVPSGRTEMFALEAAQLMQRAGAAGEPNPFESPGSDPDLPLEAQPPDRVRRYLDALIAHPASSRALRRHLERVREARFPRRSGGGTGAGGRAGGETAPEGRVRPDGAADAGADEGAPSARQAEPSAYAVVAPALPPPAPRPAVASTAEPTVRRLLSFAIDPSLTHSLSGAAIGTVTLRVPWEPLVPGPVGEYLEVVDVDPASGCFYDPVDLNDPRLLAQDGVAPSEGTPQFHQQMVYAVASMTIRNFERALGRKSLWAPGPPPPGADSKNDATYVPRLRIYPHALREANAYYSPDRKALLFGYYPASADDPGDHMPGGIVFTCLSHDIIAHETTHALLDGMHRRFLEPSNRDVLAFHEGFADIVALLQHFTMPDVLLHEIARTRGEIRAQRNVLGELAGEYGRTTGTRDALRSAIGRRDAATGTWQPLVPDPTDYQTTFEPHLRGAILVAAVFDAFLSIYEARITDLLRLATGGSGVLASGAIPPDLVKRLAETAAKAAQQVLTMCVRALDYCPPVDITFGDYLRALITADVDLVPDDDKGYRVAMIEAFRRRGIFPGDVRTLSVESLRWASPETDEFHASPALLGGVESLRDRLPQQMMAGSREAIFGLNRSVRREMHGWLSEHFASGDRTADADFLGLRLPSDAGRSSSRAAADRPMVFEVHAVRVANRVGPDLDLLRQVVIELVQESNVPLREDDPHGETMTVASGCTIVADLQTLRIAYCVRKRATSTSRIERQRAYLSRLAQSAADAPYRTLADDLEPIARLHRASGWAVPRFGGRP